MATTEAGKPETQNVAGDYSPWFMTDLREYMEEGDAAVGLTLALAEASECDPLDLDPLIEDIDPDALDTLFKSASPDFVTEFKTNEWSVTLSGSGSAVFCKPSQLV